MDGVYVPAFSVDEAVRFGWVALKRNLGLALAIGAAGVLFMLLLNGLTQASQHYAGLAMGFGLLSQLVQIVISLVWIRFALAVVDGRPIDLQQLLPDDTRTFFNYVAASILLGLMVFFGLLLFVVPGVYLALRYGFAGYVVADRRADVLDAFHRSAEITRGARGKLLLLALALLGLNAVGALAFGIGLLFTVPMSIFATSLVYRRLEARTASQPYVTAPFPAPGVV